MKTPIPNRRIFTICTAIIGLSCFFFAGCGNVKEDGIYKPDDIERIVTMSPGTSEIVFALGRGDQVVGVSSYTTYPPETEALPRCGGYFNPNFEVLLTLDPDLIITHGEAPELQQFGERYGMEVLTLEIDDLESIYDSIQRIGKAVDSTPEAKQLVEEMKTRITEAAREHQDKEPVDTLLVTGRDPGGLREVHVVGPGGFLHDLLTLVGGKNIMGDLDRQYSSVSKEVVAQRKPQVIIELHGEGMSDERQRRKYLEPWQEMSSLPAVENERIYMIEETYAMIPGPRLVKIAENMAGLLHNNNR